MPVLPRPVRAAEVVRGGALTVSERSVVADDLYLFGGTIQFLGTAEQDLAAAAALLNVVGPVEGDVSVAAGRAEIRGAVGGDVRATGAAVAIYGRVAGDVVVAGGSLTLIEGATIGGDLLVTGGSVTIVEGATVGGALRGYARNLTVEGRVGGDVRATVDRLLVTRRARVDGGLHYRSGHEATIEDRALVLGAVVRRAPAVGLPLAGPLLWAGAALPRLLGLLAAGLLLLLALPRRTVAVADAARSAPLTALPIGLGVALFGPVLALMLILTLIALPVGLLAALVYLGGLYLSQVVVGLALGRLLLRLRPGAVGRVPNLAAMAIGVSLLAALRLAPIPYLGLLLPAAIGVLGLGSLLLGLRRPTFLADRRRQGEPSSPTGPPSAARPIPAPGGPGRPGAVG